MTRYELAILLRRRWWFIVGLPLLVFIVSFLWPWHVPQYQSSARVIVTRGVTDPNSTAGMTWAREDTVAQDLPTIVSSAAFAQDVATELKRQGIAGTGTIHGANDGKIVTLFATSTSPQTAQITLDAAIAMLGKNGLRYWGDPTWTPQEPGVNIGPLDPPSAPVVVPTQRERATEAALRAGVGLIVAFALTFGLGTLAEQQITQEPA